MLGHLKPFRWRHWAQKLPNVFSLTSQQSTHKTPLALSHRNASWCKQMILISLFYWSGCKGRCPTSNPIQSTAFLGDLLIVRVHDDDNSEGESFANHTVIVLQLSSRSGTLELSECLPPIPNITALPWNSQTTHCNSIVYKRIQMLRKRTGEVSSTCDSFSFVLLDFEHCFLIAGSLERSNSISNSSFWRIFLEVGQN